jgi:predicted P-loop ATPase
MDQHTQAFEEPEPYRAHDADRLQRISERAFAHFEARGGEHGHDIEDWLAAEQEETAETDRWEDRMAKYGRKASEKVEKAMHERRRGTLKSGRSGKKVTSRKQAIAIGLSEARREGGKVPSRKGARKK